MALDFSCPSCNTRLAVPDQHAGKKVRCPKCQTTATAPAAPADDIPTVQAVARPSTAVASQVPRDGAITSGQKRCPYCGNAISMAAQRCRHCREWLPSENGGSRRIYVDFKPCPRCGTGGARRVVWTFWGSFYGPAMFSHVRCPQCQYGYNGRTGRSNAIVATIFVIIPAALIVLILAGLPLFIWAMSRR